MAIVRVQAPAITASLASATTVTNTFGVNVTAGSLLVACCAGQSGKTHTYSSTGSPTWTKIAQATETGGSGQDYSIGYCMNAPAGATTVTVTYSASCPVRGLVIAEYSGALTAAALDKSTAGLTTAATATPTDTSMTTTTDGQLIVSCLVFRNGTSPASAGASYSMIAVDQATGAQVDFGAEDRIQAAAGAIAPTFGLASASNASGIMSATFKADAVAGLPILTMAPPN